MSGPRTRPEAAAAQPARRRLLRGLLSGLPVVLLPGPATALAGAGGTQRLELVNTHTAERQAAEFLVGGRWCDGALLALDWLLRDHRSGDVHPIDRRLYGLLHALAADAGLPARYEVISGYRSPATNAMLAVRSGGVSDRSLHMEGRAIDVRLVGLPTSRLQQLALQRGVGGVGYYAASDFLHLDTGRVRSWTG